MKASECDECGDLLAVRESRYEDIPEEFESRNKHFERTGHIPFPLPKLTSCSKCDNLWLYEGENEIVTCPRCESKTESGTDSGKEIQVVQAWFSPSEETEGSA